MANPSPESSQPIMLQTAEPFRGEAEAVLRPRPAQARSTVVPMVFAAAFSAFWIGSCMAYILGFYGPAILAQQPLQEQVLLGVLSFLPPFLFLAIAWAVARSVSVGRAAEALAEATERLFSADETAGRTAARLGRAVRRELDALNAGLDGAFARLRALESVLEEQIAAIDEAGARVGVQGEAVAARLTQERERIEGLSTGMSDAAARASETVAGRAAQLKATMESAEGALKTAGHSLETQVANFRQSALLVSEAPRNAAVELDTQAKRIESVADAAMARAEFVLGRQERHRTAMTELLQKLKEESAAFENSLGTQRASIEKAIGAVQVESRKFEQVTGDTDRQIEAIMSAASVRSAQLTQSYGREVEHLRESTEISNIALHRLVDTLREAGAGAQALIGETTGRAKADAKSLVGEAMAECERLLRTAGEMSIEAGAIRESLGKAVLEVERHILNLPALAQQEAQRVRQVVRAETEEMLDLSARTLSTLHARNPSRALKHPVEDIPAVEESESEGLRGLARRLTQRPKKKPAEMGDIRHREAKPWEMSALLAAAETVEGQPRELTMSSAAAIGALQAVLADLAIDLDAIVVDGDPGESAWRRYLAGDRAIFAHRIAETIDEHAVDRIASLYRDDPRFRDAANNYLAEFETLLIRAREGDGDGLLASSLLSADTGKVFLAIAYALGRL
jgi:hypothetical protein